MSVRILMVSTEYAPMQGSIGRYTKNLVIALRNCLSGLANGVAAAGTGSKLIKAPDSLEVNLMKALTGIEIM